MKPILLSLLAISGFALTGCETTVVEHYPHHHHHPDVVVYYSSGRPYYYTAGVRYWGYPPGYRSGYVGYGYRPGYNQPYARNVEVERNTYVVNNNRTVYGNRPTAPAYRAQTYHGHAPVQTTTTTKKKKKEVYTN